MRWLALIICFLFARPAWADDPILLWASADAGPPSGWMGSGTSGAAISVWGRNLGATRGSSTLTCASTTLSTPGDFAEWGATTAPRTPPGISRITFWLNSSMANGNTDGVYVTVGGVRSNSLSFTIDNTGVIRFCSSGGDNSDGTTIAKAWTDPDAACDNMTPGDFLYLDGQTWNEQWYVGYKCRRDASGSAALSITLTSYPGEQAAINNGYIKIHDDYWTLANINFGSSYVQFGWGQDACDAAETSGAPCPTQELKMIGCDFGGAEDHAIQAWGDDQVIACNYIDYAPVDSTSYPLYICEGDDRVIADNYMDGGSSYNHMWDETGSRCTVTNTDVDRVIRRNIFERNWVNMRQHGAYVFHSGLLIGCSYNANEGTIVEDAIIRNNVFFCPDGTADRAGIELRTRLEGAEIYNNTFIDTYRGVYTYSSQSGSSEITVKGNIFDDIDDGYDVDNLYNWPAWTTERNLYDDGENNRNTSDASPVIGEPMYVDKAASNYELQADSPAIDAGLGGLVTYDFKRKTRNTPDIGAYEYGDVPISPLGRVISIQGALGRGTATPTDRAGAFIGP